MSNRYTQESFNTLDSSLNRYRELVLQYEDVILEQMILFNDIRFYVIRYRYKKGE